MTNKDVAPAVASKPPQKPVNKYPWSTILLLDTNGMEDWELSVMDEIESLLGTRFGKISKDRDLLLEAIKYVEKGTSTNIENLQRDSEWLISVSNENLIPQNVEIGMQILCHYYSLMIRKFSKIATAEGSKDENQRRQGQQLLLDLKDKIGKHNPFGELSTIPVMASYRMGDSGQMRTAETDVGNKLSPNFTQLITKSTMNIISGKIQNSLKVMSTLYIAHCRLASVLSDIEGKKNGKVFNIQSCCSTLLWCATLLESFGVSRQVSSLTLYKKFFTKGRLARLMVRTYTDPRTGKLCKRSLSPREKNQMISMILGVEGTSFEGSGSIGITAGALKTWGDTSRLLEDRCMNFDSETID